MSSNKDLVFVTPVFWIFTKTQYSFFFFICFLLILFVNEDKYTHTYIYISMFRKIPCFVFFSLSLYFLLFFTKETLPFFLLDIRFV
jgi:hypothetical protein